MTEESKANIRTGDNFTVLSFHVMQPLKLGRVNTCAIVCHHNIISKIAGIYIIIS